MNSAYRMLNRLLILFFILSLVPAAAAGDNSNNLDFVVYYSNDVRGETDPCG